MSGEANRVLHAALQLSAREREELIDILDESLEVETPEEIEAAWVSEAKRRLADIDSGKTTPVSSESTWQMIDDVIERARARRAG